MLHNPFYAGKIKHGGQLFPGSHDAIVSQELFDSVQSAMKRNSSRSETLHPRPEREYLLKGLIKCAYCGKSLWAQTLTSGSRLYREQARTRSHIDCPGDSKSIRCEIPDDQIGRIVGAIVLPEAWMDRILSRIQLADEVKKVKEARIQVEQRLKRLGEVYLDGLKSRDDYMREKKSLEDTLG
ncbi:MAG: recombinase family protein, partial [Chloroflexi bacterium]|nr:recombinase family protein [Chloroflexota bacterium]